MSQRRLGLGLDRRISFDLGLYRYGRECGFSFSFFLFGEVPIAAHLLTRAMMSSATWNTQDQAMAAASEDDFQQFLDISGMANMANMGDGMQFDFQGFQDDGPHSIMAQPRQTTDAIMSDTDPSSMIARSDGLLQNHTPAMAPLPSHMMPASASHEAISNIDAQIQYLQQQKFQQQQRQLQEQQATFFAHQGHSVPPTPQSLEMTPGSGQFYSQAEQMSSRGAYDRGYHQRLAEQDVSSPLFIFIFIFIFYFLSFAFLGLVSWNHLLT